MKKIAPEEIEAAVSVWRSQPPIDPRRETNWQFQARIVEAILKNRIENKS